MASLSAMKRRVPLVNSGDLHAIAVGRMLRSGTLDLSANPVTAVLAGPIGTAPRGWPSVFRGVGAMPPVHLDMEESVKPIEPHSFTLARFHPDKIVLRFFKWDCKDAAGRGDRCAATFPCDRIGCGLHLTRRLSSPTARRVRLR
jgi:hypothetical protein